MNYWKRNKAALAAKRRKKWKNDPDFRNRQKGRDEIRRASLREKKLKGVLATMRQRVDEHFPAGPGLQIPRKGIKGSKTIGVTTMGLAMILDRSQDTIQAWLSQGILPGYSEKVGGYRLFHKKYCLLIVEALYETLRQNLRGDSELLKEILHQKVVKARLEVLPNGGEKESEKERTQKGAGR